MTENKQPIPDFELHYSELPLGAAVYDNNGRACYVNKVMLTITGFSESSFLKMDINELTGLGHMEFIRNQAVEMLHAKGGGFPASCTYIPLDDTYRILFSEKITDISKFDISGLDDADKYKLFLDLTDSIILMLDSYGRVRYINRTGCDILGYDKEYILGKEWISHFIPREWTSEANNNITTSMNNELPLESIACNPILTASGEIRFVRWRNVSIKNSNDEITGILSSGTDITEQTKNEMRFRLADEIAGMGNWSKNLITDEYIFSDGFLRLMGYEPGTIKPDLSMLLKIVHPDDQEYTRNTILNSYKTHMGYNFVFRIIRTNGEVRHINAASMFQNDSDGNALMSYGTVVDITDLMKSKNEVIETSKSLLLAEEISNVGSYIREMETDTYTCSVGFLNILGLDTPLETLKYEDVIAFTHPDDIERVSLEIEKSLEHSDSFNFENRIIKTNGEIRYIRSKGTHIRDNSGKIVKVIGTILDITDYKENEEKLLNNLKKLEQVEQIADVGFYEYDLLTESYNLSEGFLNVCGLDSNSFIPTFETMSSTVFIGDRRLVNDTFRELDEKGTTYSFDHRVMTPHNKIKHVKSIGTYIKDEAGNPIRRIGTIIDVTDYVKATDKLMENERRLTEAEITSGTGNWEWNIETDEHYMSKGLLNILGYSSMEEIPSEWKLNAIYHKRDSHRVRMIISDAINSKKDSYSYEAVIVRPDGEPRTVSVNGILIKNENGDVIKTKGTYSDITKIKEYQQQIRENEIRMQSTEDAAHIGSWERDLRTGLYVCSPGIYRITGLKDTGGYLTLDDQLSIIHPDDRSEIIETIDTALRNNEDYQLNYRIERPDGEKRNINVKAKLLKDTDGTPIKVYGTVMDITEELTRKKERLFLESQLRNQQKLESIGILAGGVAHEINNPINGIMNYGQLILDESEQDSDINTYASEILRETERVANIVRNLLKFSRKDQSYYSKQNIRDIIENTTSLINTIFKKDRITLNINIPKSLPSINCNSQQIQQVLMNLLTNARDSLNEKYPGYHKDKIIKISARTVSKDGNRLVQLEVEDTGSGIPDEIRDNIFDPFFTTKEPGMGTGLGLSISYKIIAEHGGELYFESEPEKYTRFFMELPIANDLN